tara:strand:- start:864 stop:1655 length:792 start_codon:yes stop_codon:yes gene_type:complete
MTTKTKKKTEVATATSNVALDTILEDASSMSGLENIVSTEDMALPFLKVLSQMSNECNKTSNKFVEGAEPGNIINSVTGKLYDGEEGIDVIPCFYKREFIEWAERGTGTGAPVAIHGSEFDISTAPRDGNTNRLPSGNVVEETANHFVLVVDADGNYEQALITMKSTGRKISRKWNSMMLSNKMQGKDGKPFTPPAYSTTYRMKTMPQSNQKGTWFGWDVFKVGPVTDQGLYDTAKNFAQGVNNKTVEVKHEEDVQAERKDAF